MMTDWENINLLNDSTVGFIYRIENLISGQYYIGKKVLVYANGNDSGWRNYKSSSKYVLEDIDSIGEDNFTFTIVSVHNHVDELHVVEQGLIADHINDPLCYNKGLGGFVEHDDDTRRKISEHHKKYGHPMEGRVHPNKGKRINSGHSKNIGKVWITNGIENKFVPKDVIYDLDEGWYMGMVQVKRSTPKRDEYEANPNSCSICGTSLSFTRRFKPTCSRTCGNILAQQTRDVSGRPYGKGNPMYVRTYVTPEGIFESSSKASIANGVSVTTVRNRCLNSEKEIQNSGYGSIPKQWVGKTWKEVGWYVLDEKPRRVK